MAFLLLCGVGYWGYQQYQTLQAEEAHRLATDPEYRAKKRQERVETRERERLEEEAASAELAQRRANVLSGLVTPEEEDYILTPSVWDGSLDEAKAFIARSVKYADDVKYHHWETEMLPLHLKTQVDFTAPLLGGGEIRRTWLFYYNRVNGDLIEVVDPGKPGFVFSSPKVKASEAALLTEREANQKRLVANSTQSSAEATTAVSKTGSPHNPKTGQNVLAPYEPTVEDKEAVRKVLTAMLEGKVVPVIEGETYEANAQWIGTHVNVKLADGNLRQWIVVRDRATGSTASVRDEKTREEIWRSSNGPQVKLNPSAK